MPDVRKVIRLRWKERNSICLSSHFTVCSTFGRTSIYNPKRLLRSHDQNIILSWLSLLLLCIHRLLCSNLFDGHHHFHHLLQRSTSSLYKLQPERWRCFNQKIFLINENRCFFFYILKKIIPVAIWKNSLTFMFDVLRLKLRKILWI